MLTTKSPHLYNIYRFFKLLSKPKSPEMLTSNRLLKVPSHLFSCLCFQALWHVTLQVFLPLDTDLSHLIFPGHWNANRHDACYQEFKAGLPSWASVTTITRTGSGSRKLQDMPAVDPGLPLPPQPAENKMKPLQPTCRPLRINNCLFKILGFHCFQGRTTDADIENGHVDTVGTEAGWDEFGQWH